MPQLNEQQSLYAPLDTRTLISRAKGTSLGEIQDSGLYGRLHGVSGVSALATGQSMGELVGVTITDATISGATITDSTLDGMGAANDFTQRTFPADTNENTLETVTVTGGTLGASGALRFAFWGQNVAVGSGTFTFRVKWGGNLIGASAATFPSATDNWIIEGMIGNNGASAQKMWIRANNTDDTQFLFDYDTDTQATASDVNLIFTVQLSDGTDTGALQGSSVYFL